MNGAWLGAKWSEVAGKIDQAVQLYETRHVDPDYLTQSYQMLDRLAAANPGDLRAHYELSHVCYIVGDAAQGKSDKLKYYDQGYSAGKQAIDIDPNSADAHLWVAVNQGRQGQTRGHNSLSDTLNPSLCVRESAVLFRP